MITLPPNIEEPNIIRGTQDILYIDPNSCPHLFRLLRRDLPKCAVFPREVGDESPHHLLIGSTAVFFDSFAQFEHTFSYGNGHGIDAQYIFGTYTGIPVEYTAMAYHYFSDTYFVGIDL